MYWILICALGLSAIPDFVHVRLLYSSYNIRGRGGGGGRTIGFDEFKLFSAMFVFIPDFFFFYNYLLYIPELMSKFKKIIQQGSYMVGYC